MQPDPILPPTELWVTTQLHQDHASVVAVGEIDISNAAAFQEACQMAIGQGPIGVVVDLAGVTFLDSTGLSALIAAYNAATRIGLALTVANCSPIVSRLLEITGLLQTLTGGAGPSSDQGPADLSGAT